MVAMNPDSNGTQILIPSIIIGIIGLFAYAASKFTPGKFIILTALALLGFLATEVVYAVRARKFARILQGRFLSVLAIVAGTYLLMFAFVFFIQDKVANETSSFFQPKTLSAEAAGGFLAADVGDSLSLAPGIQSSMLCLIGANDTFVPPDLSRHLSSAWGGKTTVIEYPGEGHDLLFNDNSSCQDIITYLAWI